MYLSLTNFGCYTNAQFDIGENGIVLFSGSSGAGKSTIMRAIVFALYGKGTKVVKCGKKSCKVELKFQDLSIVRTKRPNRLIVNDSYENDAGQALINEKFGNVFDTVGYISQNAINSFIVMSPMEKLAFLEKFAFQGVNIVDVKAKLSGLIKRRNEILIATESKLETLTEVLAQTPQPPHTDFPLPSTKKNRPIVVKNEYTRSKNVVVLHKRVTRSLARLTQELNDLRVMKATKKEINESVQRIETQLKELREEDNSFTFIGDEKLERYEVMLSFRLSYRELVVMKEKYTTDLEKLRDIEKSEIAEMKEEVEKMSKQVWQEYSAEECDRYIQDYQDLLTDIDTATNLRKKMKKYSIDEKQLRASEKELTRKTSEVEELRGILLVLEREKDVYNCPNCDVSLRLVRGELKVTEDKEYTPEHSLPTIKQRIAKLQQRVTDLKNIVTEYRDSQKLYINAHTELKTVIEPYGSEEEFDEYDKTDIQEQLSVMRRYKACQEELKRKVTDLTNKIQTNSLSSTYVSFEKDVRRRKKLIDRMERDIGKEETASSERMGRGETSSGDGDDIDEIELQRIISEEKGKKERKERMDRNIRRLETELKDKTEKGAMIEKNFLAIHTKLREESFLESQIKKRENEIKQLEAKRELHLSNIQKIEEYQQYEQQMKRYNEVKESVEKIQAEETECRHEYAAAMRLKEKILEAESVAISNLIATINTHARMYLDDFFSDGGISASLSTHKKSKKGTEKPQIHLIIEYKDMEADLGMLSGGELSRVILAFTLALSHIFNTPMIMLDECTSSLDQELNSTVIDSIKENNNGKLVLIVMHQAVNGIFDRVIRFGEERE